MYSTRRSLFLQNNKINYTDDDDATEDATDEDEVSGYNDVYVRTINGSHHMVCPDHRLKDE